MGEMAISDAVQRRASRQLNTLPLYSQYRPSWVRSENSDAMPSAPEMTLRCNETLKRAMTCRERLASSSQQLSAERRKHNQKDIVAIAQFVALGCAVVPSSLTEVKVDRAR
jgi:hypothetical protein